MKNFLIHLFLISIFIITASFSLFYPKGQMKDGKYYAPSKHYQCLNPIGHLSEDTKWCYYENTKMTIGGKSDFEVTTFVYENLWKIAGSWHIRLNTYKTRDFQYNIHEQAVRSLDNLEIAKVFLSGEIKTVFKKNLTINGFPALQYYYEGQSPEQHPTGMIVTCIIYEDAFAIIDLLFLLDDRQFEMTNWYQQVAQSFSRNMN